MFFIQHGAICMWTVVRFIRWHTSTQANSPDSIIINQLISPSPAISHPPLSPSVWKCTLSVCCASCNTTPGHSYFIYFASTPSSQRTGFPTRGREEEKTRECLSQELRDHLNVHVYTPLVTRTEKCRKIGVWSWLIIVHECKNNCHVFQWPLSVSITS